MIEVIAQASMVMPFCLGTVTPSSANLLDRPQSPQEPWAAGQWNASTRDRLLQRRIGLHSRSLKSGRPALLRRTSESSTASGPSSVSTSTDFLSALSLRGSGLSTSNTRPSFMYSLPRSQLDSPARRFSASDSTRE